MKLKIIACGVLEPELARLAAESEHEIGLELLQAGLHDEPDKLREQAQASIDRAAAEGWEAAALGYGLCGRGVSGLIARGITVVIPRAHDCMTLFLGSRQAYRDQFSKHPGTFYITPGWYEHKVRPLGHENELHYEVACCVEEDARYPELCEKFGAEEAAHIIHFQDSWKRNYSRAAFIDTGLAAKNEESADYAREMAEALGWRFERVCGDPHLLVKLLAGQWDEKEFLVLRPGQRSTTTGDEAILTAIETLTPSPSPMRPQTVDGRGESETASRADRMPCDCGSRSADPVTAPEAAETPAPRDLGKISGQLGLGIDAGGTYTDCVLYDLDHRKVICKAKALTTHHNLSVGIDEGLRKLSLPEGLQVALVALSTTLATNSIVEGKGGRPGAIIMTPLSHNASDFNWRPLKFVGGALDIRGNEQSAPDREEIAQAVRELLDEGVDAFAVSGYASVRNPEHELLVREVIAEQCGLPIVCGHELSSRLDYLARANTAILNARLLSVIGKLLEAVRSSLSAIGVAAPIMVVKGDGSLINEQTARERPVETILSGPAASVSGARHLTEVSEGIVFDMGGTTTDTAVLAQGLVRINPEGATVGGWRTSVEAADIATVGLGGDSHISFNADRELLVGPRRVLPLCYLAAESEDVKATLERLDPKTITNRGNSQALEFFRLGRDHEDAPLDERSLGLLAALQEGPLSRERLARAIDLVEASLLRTEKLEDMGYIQRSALTPTDLLHVTGEFMAWDAEAARLALGFFAGLYGAEPEVVIELVREQIVRRLCLQVIHHVSGRAFDERAALKGEDYLLDLALGGTEAGPLAVSLKYEDTIVALGAPVQPFFPEVARRLNARLVIPEHAEVANAIGAVASEVVVRERAIVRPGELSAYVVHTRSGKREFEKLETAVAAARADAERLAVERASRSGAASPRVRLDVDERRGLLADGAEELIEVIVEATAAGRPELEVAT
ncbi:MAG: DUF1638 domain-containing protein [Armatimonadota bacterium]